MQYGRDEGKGNGKGKEKEKEKEKGSRRLPGVYYGTNNGEA